MAESLVLLFAIQCKHLSPVCSYPVDRGSQALLHGPVPVRFNARGARRAAYKAAPDAVKKPRGILLIAEPDVCSAPAIRQALWNKPVPQARDVVTMLF